MKGVLAGIVLTWAFAKAETFYGPRVSECLKNKLFAIANESIREICEKNLYVHFYRGFLINDDPRKFKQVPYGVPPSLYFSREIKKCMRSYVPVYKFENTRIFVTYDSIITVYLNLPDQKKVMDVLVLLHNGCLDRSEDYCIFPVYSQFLEDEMRLILMHKKKPMHPFSSKAGQKIYKSKFEYFPLWGLRILHSLRRASLEHCQLRSDNIFVRLVLAPLDSEPYGDLDLSLLKSPRYFEWTSTEEGKFWQSTEKGYRWMKHHQDTLLFDQPIEYPNIDPEVDEDNSFSNDRAEENKKESYGFNSQLVVEINDFQKVQKRTDLQMKQALDSQEKRPARETSFCKLPEEFANWDVKFGPFAFDRFSMGLILLEMECQRIQCDFFKFKDDLFESIRDVKTIPISENDKQDYKLSKRLSELGEYFERNSSPLFWKTVRFLLGLSFPKTQTQNSRTESAEQRTEGLETAAEEKEKFFQFFFSDESLRVETATIEEEFTALDFDQIDSVREWLHIHKKMNRKNVIHRFLNLQSYLESRQPASERKKTQSSDKASSQVPVSQALPKHPSSSSDL